METSAGGDSSEDLDATEVGVGGVSGELGIDFNSGEGRGVSGEGGHDSGDRFLFGEMTGVAADSEGKGMDGETGCDSGSVVDTVEIVADVVGRDAELEVPTVNS
jgi:hypothetical protein